MTVTIEGLLKSMLPAGATSSSFRLLKMLGEGARALESAACRPLGTPSSTNLSLDRRRRRGGVRRGLRAAAARRSGCSAFHRGLGGGARTRGAAYRRARVRLELDALYLVGGDVEQTRVDPVARLGFEGDRGLDDVAALLADAPYKAALLGGFADNDVLLARLSQSIRFARPSRLLWSGPRRR